MASDEKIAWAVDEVDRLLDERIPTVTREALAQAAAWEAKAEGLEKEIKRLGGAIEIPVLSSPCRGCNEIVDHKPGCTIHQSLSAPRPEPSRILEVVRAAVQVVDEWDATADALERGRDESASPEERSLALAVEHLTPEERAALAEDP